MISVVFRCYFVQLTFFMMYVNGVRKSQQAQQYRGFFNGPQHYYQQQMSTNLDSQKWYYSSNQQPSAYSWQWTNQDVPSSNFIQNTYPNNQMDSFTNWACGRSQTANRFARIMGGQDAVPHSYPWMISLSKRSLNNLHLCGGVLLTQRHVITAAHCMEDFDGPSDLNIIAGTHFANEKRNPMPALAITIHPQYEPETFANDVAIITLVSALPQNDPRIGTICLPPDDIPGKTYPTLKTPGVAIGWGSTYFGGNPSMALKQVALPILDTNTWPCNIYVTYAPGQICAGILSGGADTCQADSGSMLTLIFLVIL